MCGFEIKLSGKSAVAVVLIFVVISAMGYPNKKESIKIDGRNKIQEYLMAEYGQYALDGVREAMISNMSERLMEEKSKEALGFLNVDVTSVSLRGNSSNYIAKVEIEVDGQQPPDGKPVRYFRMQYSWVSGWTVLREASGYSYKMKMF